MPSTLSTDPIDILLGHDRWATRALLARCAALSEEQFNQRFDIGLGSLHDTLTHIVGAVRSWTDAVGQRPRRPAFSRDADGQSVRRTPAELQPLWEEACSEFQSVVRGQRPHLAQTREWPFRSDCYRFTVAAAVLHVTNHGTHHRAQCLNMLKRLGHPVHEDLDVLAWQIAGEP